MTPSLTPLPQTFHISPLIRITLLGLYGALTLPLPFLAQATAAPVPPLGLGLGLVGGGLFLYGALTERVVVTDEGIAVNHPPLWRWCGRRGWFLPWSTIVSLKPRWTGQGGIVYYFVSTSQDAYLLPMRIAGFAQLLRQVESKTNLDTRDVKPLAQPWMYLILLVCTLGLLAIDAWVLGVATQGLAA